MIPVSAANVAKLLPITKAIEIVEKTMIDVSNGKTDLPLRNILPVGGGNMLGIMPGVLHESGLYGVKLLSLFPANPAKGLSSHIGVVLLFDPETGIPSAAINADMLTAIRTSAASAAATRVLARKDATRMTVVGTGEQAQFHIRAIASVRDLKQVTVVGRSTGKGEEFAAAMALGFPEIAFAASDNVEQAVRDADIVCTVTSSAKVVLRGAWISAGTHVNAVGASIPSMQEIDSALIARAVAFVDYMPSALAQAKDVIDGLAQGVFEKAHLAGEIGALFAGRTMGRTSADEVTLYRSLGVAAQDLACADYVRQAAAQSNIKGVNLL